MAFTDTPGVGEKLGAALGFLALAALARFGLDQLGIWDTLFRTNSPEAVAGEIEQAMRATEATERLYATMEQRFPQDYHRLINGMSAAYLRNRSEQEALAFGNQYMERFNATNLPNLAKAPDATINALGDATQSTIEALAAQDTALCARFAMTGLRPDEVSDPALKEQLQAALAVQMLGMAEGRDTPATRAEPDAADVTALAQALQAQGLSTAQIDGFLAADGTLERMSPDGQCSTGRRIYRALNGLPDAQSARLGAVILIPPTG